MDNLREQLLNAHRKGALLKTALSLSIGEHAGKNSDVISELVYLHNSGEIDHISRIQAARGLKQRLLTGKVRVGGEEGKKENTDRQRYGNTDRQAQTWTKGMTMTDTRPIREKSYHQEILVSAVILAFVGRCLSVSSPEKRRADQHERK